VPTTPLPIDAVGLARLAAAALAPEPEAEVDLSHIRRSYLTIREAALQVLGRLEEPGARAAFAELSADRARGDRVVLFLALLELFKLGHVDLEQVDRPRRCWSPAVPAGSTSAPSSTRWSSPRTDRLDRAPAVSAGTDAAAAAPTPGGGGTVSVTPPP
jgi:hypothetical protein